jgi:hypothetical protein
MEKYKISANLKEETPAITTMQSSLVNIKVPWSMKIVLCQNLQLNFVYDGAFVVVWWT